MIRNRATELFPSILLTVLSMIQALALELLWTRLRESPYLWNAGWDAVIGWIQVAAMLLGFLVVWLFYVSIVMRFRWLPSLSDSVVPFAVGILEFILIDLMGPDSLPLWFCAMALIFAVSISASHTIYRRARRDPANREFFDSVQPATLRDFAPALAAVAGIALLGLLLHLSGGPRWLALVSLLAAIAALANQVRTTHRFWQRSIQDTASPEAAA